MQMIMVVYNEAIDDEVMEVLANCALKNYTKILGAFGKGSTSGTHLGNDIWPGRNNILFVSSDERATRQLLLCIRELRKKLGKEGLKAFVLPVEEIS